MSAISVVIVVLVINLLCTFALTAVVLWPKKKPECDHQGTFSEFNASLRALDADMDDLFERMKRLTARKGVAAVRDERKAGAMIPGETPEQWKARMRKAKNAGESPVEE